jgi:hypothetical protein
MVLDALTSADRYAALHPAFARACAFLTSTDRDWPITGPEGPAYMRHDSWAGRSPDLKVRPTCGTTSRCG